MNPLRIVHTEAATSFGGQERRIFKEMKSMREQGHYLEAICQPQALLYDHLTEAGFIVHTMPMDGPVNYFKSLIKIYRILRRGNFSVLNTHSRRDTIIAAAAGRLARTPLIVRTRHLSNKPRSLYSYTYLPHCVTTVSEHLRQQLIACGVSPNKVATLYSPVDLPESISCSTLRSELNLKSDDIIVGCIAVMRAKKGHRDLIDALCPLFPLYPSLHMVFVGGGSPIFEQTQAYIQQLRLSSRIHLMGTRQDIANLLAGFNIFALATQHEASGTVFVEAAASGLPVIGTNVGGVAEMMRNQITGFLVPPHDQSALTQTLQRLIDDPALRTKMGQAGKKMVWEEGLFSSHHLATHTTEIYHQWLNQRK